MACILAVSTRNTAFVMSFVGGFYQHAVSRICTHSTGACFAATLLLTEQVVRHQGRPSGCSLKPASISWQPHPCQKFSASIWPRWHCSSRPWDLMTSLLLILWTDPPQLHCCGHWRRFMPLVPWMTLVCLSFLVRSSPPFPSSCNALVLPPLTCCVPCFCMVSSCPSRMAEPHPALLCAVKVALKSMCMCLLYAACTVNLAGEQC